MITWENYEEYMMMHADGELAPADEQELTAFVNAHPELKSELAVYEQTKMSPDSSIVYADKETLLKPLPQKRVIAFPHWQRYAVAAGIAAIMIISFLKLNDTGKAGNDMVKTDTTRSISAPVNATNAPQDVAQAAKDTTAPAVTTEPQMAATKEPVKKNEVKGILQPQRSPRHYNVVNAPVLVQKIRNTPETIDRIIPLSTQQLPGSNIKTEALAAREVAAYTMPVAEEKKSSFIDRLPIEDTKKTGLESVATVFNNTYDKINEIKHDINEKSITVRVEKRKLILSF